MSYSPQIAKIAVSAATYHIDKPYEYLIPDDAAGVAAPGKRVLIPFGRGNKFTEGIILSISNESKYGKQDIVLKSIASFIDDVPVVDEENIRLALWMSDRFFCTVYDALRTMMPSKIDFKKKVKSREYAASDLPAPHKINLNCEQSAVYDEILELLKSDSPEAALLYGITGSGKTLVYIKLIEAALAFGKTAIVLVPEIALTPQTVRIFESHFGNAVAVLHSALGDGERYMEWKRIRKGEVNVVIGTRSAVFAPLKNIGLIVIDEEQEHTYKSESSPRYHAREVAKHRITRASGLLLLSSATPSIDSMYAARTERYKLFKLQSRFNEKALPPVIIVDMKVELKAGNGGLISSVLYEQLDKNIQKGEQSILFLNRRGASPVVACGECGYTYKCRNCSVSMTYHMSNKQLLCHYCGFKSKVDDVCVECGGKLKYIGAGTQKVEVELSNLFPNIEIIRMDADTTTRKNSHDKLLEEFKKRKAHILLGTQMVTKGLDFENVTLVGVLSADLSLYMSDYRANERTFSLITQVVGRAGRGVLPGRAVIQTFTPENKVIALSSNQDHESFYESEIALREALEAPPIRDLISLTVTGADESVVIIACDALKHMLQCYFRGEKGIKLLGHAPAPISKVSNKYIYNLIVNCENNKRVRETIAHVIREFSRSKKSSGVAVYADVDNG